MLLIMILIKGLLPVALGYAIRVVHERYMARVEEKTHRKLLTIKQKALLSSTSTPDLLMELGTRSTDLTKE